MHGKRRWDGLSYHIGLKQEVIRVIYGYGGYFCMILAKINPIWMLLMSGDSSLPHSIDILPLMHLFGNFPSLWVALGKTFQSWSAKYLFTVIHVLPMHCESKIPIQKLIYNWTTSKFWRNISLIWLYTFSLLMLNMKPLVQHQVSHSIPLWITKMSVYQNSLWTSLNCHVMILL